MGLGAEIDDVPADISRFFDQDGSSGPGPDAGPLERAFFAHRGPVVHKWHHYLPLYDRYFAPFRGRPVRMLEIGVSKGGSMDLWRDYFGPGASITGIDIEPACAAFDGRNGNRVRIGSQADPAFLRDVIVEMGGADIVLDDGSHVASDQRAAFDALFPLVEDGGLYVVEDLHTAYWRPFGGGYRSTDSFVAQIKTLVDDMHHWYHAAGERVVAAAGHVAGLHIHDSIAFIEKRKVARPVNSMRGAPQ